MGSSTQIPTLSRYCRKRLAAVIFRAAFSLPLLHLKGYDFHMTELLERAVESVRALPPEAQDALAHFLLQFAGDDEAVIPLSAEEQASLEESLAQAERGEFATDEQVRAIWAKHGL